ncbi:MAG: alcohol dehydrogenase catalytic domain-containing protein [Chloroflexota bacterium]
MRGLVFEGIGQINLRDIPDPRVEDPHDVVVAVEATGICGTDLRLVSDPPLLKGTPGSVLGHEIVGHVIDAGSNAGIAVGTRVVLEPNVVCHSCAACFDGRFNLCSNLRHLGTHIPGGFADKVALPGSCCIPIREDMSLERAVLTEGLACVLNATRRADLHPGRSAVIFGAGPIGRLFLAVIKAAGMTDIVVTEISPERARQARERGAIATFDPADGPIPEQIATVLPDGADLVVDTVGMLFHDALEVVRKGGRILEFGLADEAVLPVRPVLIAKKEVTIQGSYLTHGYFHPAVRLLSNPAFDVDGMLGKVFTLDRVMDGFEVALQRGADIKIAITP